MPSVTVVVVVIFYFSQDILLSIDSPGQPFFYLNKPDQVIQCIIKHLAYDERNHSNLNIQNRKMDNEYVTEIIPL